MESLSRVKKNQSLRSEIEHTKEETFVSPALSSYADRLNKINPVLSSVTTQQAEDPYRPLHTKRNEAFNEMPKQTHDDGFQSHYMQDFLEEVKAYNLDNGYRKNEDTQKNILQSTQEEPETIVQIPLEEDPINQEIKRALEFDETLEFPQESVEPDNLLSTTELQAVVEETQKLRVQLSEYEKGLVDMNESVLSSSRLLNSVVFVLVLVLMIMLGVAIYWVLYAKGFY